ncbi:MAG: hypothetical protein GXO98_02805 [Nitrospirae bacterium]|nr:hypothetical protein [Nitrospirota bacterium]
MKISLGIIILLMTLISSAYGKGEKAAQVTIEAMMVETPADNLKEKLGTLKGRDDFFKDPGKVKTLIDIPRIMTLAGSEGNIQITKPIYYIVDAKVDENGDIICKLKKEITGIVFKALPLISEENPEVVTVDYQLEVKTFIKRVNPQMPAIADIQELKSLGRPIINTRKIGGKIILKNGSTIVTSKVTGHKLIRGLSPGNTKNELRAKTTGVEESSKDIVALTLLTARW